MRSKSLVISILSAALFSSLCYGQVAPNTLRAELTAAGVRLTWEAGVGPYGVYRSADPSGVDSADNYVGVTGETFFLDAYHGTTNGNQIVADKHDNLDRLFTDLSRLA